MLGDGPNFIARFVLFFVWPLLALWMMKRTHRPTATFFGLFFAGLLLLPEQTFFKIPGLPYLGKHAILPLSLFIPLYLFHRRAFRGRFRFNFITSLLFVSIILSALITGASNGDPLFFGATVLPGISAYDGMHMAISDLLRFFLPFYAASVLLRDAESLRLFFRILVRAVLLASLIALFEMRMSPQLHQWFYGFIPIDSWSQVIRSSGYRPLGFTRHGLAFVLYFLSAAIAAFVLRRTQQRGEARPIRIWVAPYLVIITLAFGSLGATLYAIAGIAALKLLPSRLIMLAAIVAGCVVASFPYKRYHGEVDTEAMVESARANADEERAQSLEFRFMNEDLLLERVRDRLYVGWGEFGRADVYDEFDGRRVTVRDGAWIIQLGDRGLIGLLWFFGMLLLPLFSLLFAFGRADRTHRRLLAALALLVAISAADLLPNGAFHPLGFIFAGALLGQLRTLKVHAPAKVRSAKKQLANIIHRPLDPLIG